MKKKMFNIFFDAFLVIILFIGNVFIGNSNYYFLLIYLALISYHIYVLNLILKNKSIDKNEIKTFLITSFLLYLFSYFIICDPNPFLGFIFYHLFYPNFIRAILIIIIHTYFLSISIRPRRIKLDNLNEDFPFRLEFRKIRNDLIQSYFLSKIFRYLREKNLVEISFLVFILLFCLDILLFKNRIALWVYFNKKEKTLPISSSKNRIFYIASNIVNMEKIIDNFIGEMKKLIYYLGENNCIISIVENGDSIDNTRKYLEDFKNFLNSKNILNKFILKKEVEDIRNKTNPYIKGSRLRIEFYSKLRNKCFEFLYEIPNLNFDNVIIIFFNDIVFKYEDIINLLSTNKEDFDSACGFDIISHYFYDRWVTIDLDGNGLKKYFPFFINKEAQDLILNHKPIRVFSCWNGVIAFKASPLKDKKIQFRHKINYTIPKNLLNNPNKDYFESECTYFNIDLFSLGYNKKFINPDVRVAYNYDDYFSGEYFAIYLKHISYSFILYFMGFLRNRNKLMSDYVSQNIELNSILKNWYLENKINKN